MSMVVVTGGTGTLGLHLVPALLAANHQVRVVSRTGKATACPPAEVATGDVLRTDLRPLFDGADCVVHAATSPSRRARKTEVQGTRNVISASQQAGVQHVVYVSIVGVDRHRFPYYRAKREAEQVVESSGGSWAIARATQFHELLDQFLSAPVFPKTPGLRFQPVDAGEFAAHLSASVTAGHAGRLEPFAGPEILTIEELRDARRSATGHAARLVRVPRVGFVRDFDRGLHLAEGRSDGSTRWSEWLAKRG